MRRFLPNRLSLNQSLLAAIPLSLVVAWLTGFWTCGAAFAMAALCVLAVRNPQQEFVERWPWLARVLSKSAASPQEESFTAPAPAPLPPPRRRVKRDSNSSPVEQMVAQGRVALLLRPQIAANLSEAELQTAQDALDESMAIVPQG